MRNELTEIQKTLSLEFAFTEAEHQGALFALQARLQSVEGPDRGSRVRAGGDDGGGELMTKGLKAALASASWCCWS